MKLILDCKLSKMENGIGLKEKEYANTAEALIYEKNEPRELTVTWGNIYGSLEPGHYRVTKWFFEFSESGVGQEFLLASEFTLD